MALEQVSTLHGAGIYTDGEMHSVVWNLDNEAGRRVASGVYLAVARFQTPAGERVERRKVMVVH